MKRSRTELEADLADLQAKRQCIEKDIRALERTLEALAKAERRARGVSISWELFCKAARKCQKAWHLVNLAPEDQAGACEHCDDDCSEDDEWTFMQHGSARDFHELRPLAGCPWLVMCSYCLQEGRADDLLACQTKVATVRVDPADYDSKWQARFKEEERKEV